MTPDDGRPVADLYEADYYAWTQAQARALRAGRLSALDIENLAEEVETLGRSERRACESFITLILEHFLKVEFIDRAEEIHHHAAEIEIFRLDLEKELTPSLRAELPHGLDPLYRYARRRLELRLKEQRRPAVDLPQDCPYTWDDILGREDGWLPVSQRT